MESAIDEQTACVVVQHPNFFGCLEDVENAGCHAHAKGAALIVAADPISLGLLKRPGDYGADIVVAEGQSLGTPMSFGGPYLGILACREKFLRRMPGRLVGRNGRSAESALLGADAPDPRTAHTAREGHQQHLHEPGADGIACHGLPVGDGAAGAPQHGGTLPEKGTLCVGPVDRRGAPGAGLHGAHLQGVRRPRAGGRIDDLLSAASQAGIMAGVPLGCWYPELEDCLLVAVTEKRTKAEIDRMTEIIRSVLG